MTPGDPAPIQTKAGVALKLPGAMRNWLRFAVLQTGKTSSRRHRPRGRWASFPQNTVYTSKKPPFGAAFFRTIGKESGDPERRVRLAAIGHEANAHEAQDHHCPSGRLRNGASMGRTGERHIKS